MAEFKVRHIGTEEEKGNQQVEAELLAKHEEKQSDTVDAAPKTTESVDTESVVEDKKEIGDGDVLSYINDRYNKEINSVEELLATRESNEELPEDVVTFLKYKKDTGRGIEDFVKLNRDLDAYDDDRLLEEYYKEANPHLDSEDIEFELETKFAYDNEYDDEAEVKKRKIAKKQELAKAKQHFNDLKEQYKTPLESREVGGSKVNEEKYKAYQEYVAQSKTEQEDQERRRDYFYKKTNEVFNAEFEGFKFKVGDKDLVFKPGETMSLMKNQSDVNNFINSHIDDNGLIKDAPNYHRSLAVAMNPEAFANFFYEQGKTDAVENSARESKNIDMRRTPETVSSGGFKVSSGMPDSGNRLVIRSNKQ